MTQPLWAELLPPSYSKMACRKLHPFKSSLKDGLRSVFQDCKTVKGQCKLRARHHIAASAGTLRFTWAVPDARWHHKECRKWGWCEAFLEFFPPPNTSVWDLPCTYRGHWSFWWLNYIRCCRRELNNGRSNQKWKKKPPFKHIYLKSIALWSL